MRRNDTPSNAPHRPADTWIWSLRAMALMGLVLTWTFNIRYFQAGGDLLPGNFWGSAFANPLTTAITLDVYWAAAVFSLWVWRSRRRIGNRQAWLYIFLCFGVALAVALPLFLQSRHMVAGEEAA